MEATQLNLNNNNNNNEAAIIPTYIFNQFKDHFKQLVMKKDDNTYQADIDTFHFMFLIDTWLTQKTPQLNLVKKLYSLCQMHSSLKATTIKVTEDDVKAFITKLTDIDDVPCIKESYFERKAVTTKDLITDLTNRNYDESIDYFALICSNNAGYCRTIIELFALHHLHKELREIFNQIIQNVIKIYAIFDLPKPQNVEEGDEQDIYIIKKNNLIHVNLICDGHNSVAALPINMFTQFKENEQFKHHFTTSDTSGPVFNIHPFNFFFLVCTWLTRDIPNLIIDTDLHYVCKMYCDLKNISKPENQDIVVVNAIDAIYKTTFTLKFPENIERLIFACSTSEEISDVICERFRANDAEEHLLILVDMLALYIANEYRVFRCPPNPMIINHILNRRVTKFKYEHSLYHMIDVCKNGDQAYRIINIDYLNLILKQITDPKYK